MSTSTARRFVMAGASLTLVRLDDAIEDLLAAPAEVAEPVFFF